MSEVLQAIKNRRSIRKYTDQPISDEVLQQLLEAVQWAPSWANTQCWELVVVKDPAQREKLQATMGKGNPATKAIVSAPLLIVLCGKLKEAGYYKEIVTTKFGDWFLYDLGIAGQNLHLACQALGLGMVTVGLFDQAVAAKVLGVPEGYELVAMMPIGYPDQNPKPPKRKEISDFTHYDRW
jgi:nitroreductase